MDTLYITTQEGGKITDPDLIATLTHQLGNLIGCPETAG
jgi:hypothetical protein